MAYLESTENSGGWGGGNVKHSPRDGACGEPYPMFCAARLPSQFVHDQMSSMQSFRRISTAVAGHALRIIAAGLIYLYI